MCRHHYGFQFPSFPQIAVSSDRMVGPLLDHKYAGQLLGTLTSFLLPMNSFHTLCALLTVAVPVFAGFATTTVSRFMSSRSLDCVKSIPSSVITMAQKVAIAHMIYLCYV